MQHCVNGDTSSQWEMLNSDPHRIKTLESIAKKFGTVDLIRSAGRPHMPNSVTIYSRGTSGQMGEI